MKKSVKFLLIILASFSVFSCVDDKDKDPVIELEAVTVENLAAPNDVIDRSTGVVTEEKPFIYFSFETNSIIANSEGDWDVAFKGTGIIVNGGISGSGNAEGAAVQGIFEEMGTIPSTVNLKADSESGLAIPGGSGNGWYNYNSTTHIVSPIPGSILVFKTNRGNFVKVEILSYYKDNPPLSEVDPMTTPGAHYTFRFVLQPDGSRIF